MTQWLQKNGIMRDHTTIDRKTKDKAIKDAGCKNEKEYLDKCAQRAGFKNNADRYRDYRREWRYETGRQLPKELCEYSPIWFGEFTENLMIQTFDDAIKMPYGNPGYDWTCKRGDKIENKGRCLRDENRRWDFAIDWNNIADWFILSAWDNRESLNPMHVWAFHRDEIVRGRIFWMRTSFSIANIPKKLKELEKNEITIRLEKLKELCSTNK